MLRHLIILTPFKPHQALIDFAIPSWTALSSADAAVVREDVRSFLEREFLKIPWFIKYPMAIMQLIFLLYARIKSKWIPFSKLDSVRKNDVILDANVRLGMPFQVLIRLYRSLTLLAFMEHSLVRPTFGLTDYKLHQLKFRKKRDELLHQKNSL